MDEARSQRLLQRMKMCQKNLGGEKTWAGNKRGEAAGRGEGGGREGGGKTQSNQSAEAGMASCGQQAATILAARRQISTPIAALTLRCRVAACTKPLRRAARLHMLRRAEVLAGWGRPYADQVTGL